MPAPSAGAPGARSAPLRTLVDGVAAGEVPITDRGLHYGDGLFETIKLRGGVPCLWDAHVDRLRRGAERLAIPSPDTAELYSDCLRLAGGVRDGIAKLILTRGDGHRGYRLPDHPHPRRILALYPEPRFSDEWGNTGVDVIVCRTTLGHNSQLAGIKHLNRLEQILARAEWSDPAIAEGLMCDGDGNLIGGTMSNLFILRDGWLVTPRLEQCGIAGTVRRATLGLAGALGFRVAEESVGLVDLRNADGAFLTNAIIGLWPIRRCSGRDLGHAPLPTALVTAVRRAANGQAWR